MAQDETAPSPVTAVHCVCASTCFPASSRTIVMPAQRPHGPIDAVGIGACGPRAVIRQRVTTRSSSAIWSSIFV